MATQKKSLIGASKKTASSSSRPKVAASAKSVAAKKLANMRLAVNHNQTNLRPLR